MSKICQNLKNYNFGQKLDKLLTNFRPGLEFVKNNRWDKFWTNLGFGVFLNAVRRKKCPDLPRACTCVLILWAWSVGRAPREPHDMIAVSRRGPLQGLW